MEYRLLIDLEVLETLDNLPKRVRSQLLNQFQKIRDFPTNYSDYYEYDTAGRRVAICICGSLAIHDWIDSADRHVKVLALTPAGR